MKYKFNLPEMGAGKQAEMWGNGSGSIGSISPVTRYNPEIPPEMNARDVRVEGEIATVKSAALRQA
jgi:hypothetical protein